MRALNFAGFRADGRRSMGDTRKLKIATPAPGYVEVRLGMTMVSALATVTAEKPSAHRPNEGSIKITCRPCEHVDEARVAEINQIFRNFFLNSGILDLTALCVESGDKVWAINVQVSALQNDGNLIDAMCMAVLMSLKTFSCLDEATTRLTARAGVDVVNDEIDKAKLRASYVSFELPLHHLPICSTFGILAHPANPLKDEHEKTFFPVDPGFAEEAEMSGSVSIFATGGGLICGIQKLGGAAISPKAMNSLIKKAVARAEVYTNKVEEKCKAVAVFRHNQLRRIHQAWDEVDLVDVEHWPVRL